MRHLKNINEQNINSIINDIKDMLIDDYGCETWKQFVDHQELGKCQSIVSSIVSSFPKAKKVFGEIEVDDSYTDEYGEEQTLMTHHWVEIDGEIYDFSKGTLSDYIEWIDLYEVESEDWRYNLL